MCGIAGGVSPDGIDPGVLTRMGDALEHRGPDGEGYLLASPGEELRRLGRDRLAGAGARGPAVGFAHRRLTIIDLSSRSDQPLVDASGECAIAYNGELYNYLELREELSALGHRFRSVGDTEVVLEAYREWGSECVRRFVGMWAFAILDRRRRSLLLSRDRFGVKPLFHARAGRGLYFASEIKALLGIPGLEPEPNEAILRRYLLTGVVDHSEQTFFSGIESVPPAHNLLIDVGDEPSPRLKRYWSYPPQDGRIAEPAAAERLRELLEESVRIHARSDVPVGTCLSGGLDSSSIVCVAERLRAEGRVPRYTHSAFGYVPRDESLSERRHMEAVAESTGARMYFVEVREERFAERLLDVVRLQDEPFGSTSIAAQWFVFEAARREGMKVMLDGQGADEVLGGYQHFYPVVAAQLLRGWHLLSYARFRREHVALLDRAPLARSEVVASLTAKPAGWIGRERRPPLPPSAELLSDEMRERARGEFAPDTRGSLQEQLRLHSESVGLPSLLRFEDRNSMSHSVEARVPLLDHRLVEFAFGLPDDLKIRGVETKRVLREAMRGILPESVRARRDKVGFRAEPNATRLIAERHRDSLLAARTPYEERWLDGDAVAAALDASASSAEAEFLAWRAINAKLWLRLHWGGSDDLLG